MLSLSPAMEPMNIKKNKIKYIWFIGIFLLSFIVIWPLFQRGYWESADGEWMVIRFSAFHEALRDGHFPVRWTQRLNHGFGYPVMNFLYPLPFYLAEIAKLLGFGFVNSIKIVFGLSVIASGIGMYIYTKKWGRLEALFASLLYILAPYRIFDIYFRGSLGESVALACVPFLFFFIDRLFKKPNLTNTIFSGIIYAALITSHNVIAILFTPVLILYIIWTSSSRKKISSNALSCLFLAPFIGILLSAFFWLPALWEIKFTRTPQITIANYSLGLLSTTQLLQIGLVHWIVLILAFLFKERFFSSLSFVVAFLLHKVSAKLLLIFPIIEKIQFPWRMTTIFIFNSSIAGAELLRKIRNPKIKISVVITLLLVLLKFSSFQMQNINFVNKDEGFYTTNDDTTTVKKEFTPIWVKEDPTNKKDKLFEIDTRPGSYEIINQQVRTGYNYLQIRLQDPMTITANIHYFPGWKIYLDDELVDYDPEKSKGLLKLDVTPGRDKLREIKFVFEKTPIRKIAENISAVTGLLILFYFIYKKLARNNFVKANALTSSALAFVVIVFFILSHLHAYREIFNPVKMGNAYNNSQWVNPYSGKNVPIGDSGLYAWAGWEYVHGKNPILINPEMPPLGKYLIGLGIILTQRPALIGLIFSSFALASYFLLANVVLNNKWLALISTSLLSIEPVMKNLMYTIMLDGLQLGFLNLTFFSFIKGLKNKNWFIVTSIMLGAVASTKFYVTGLGVTIVLIGYLFISKRWKLLKKFIYTLPLAGFVHVVQYAKYFSLGNSLRDYLGVQKWIFDFYRQGNSQIVPPGSYWLLVLFNKWRVWFGQEWGRYTTIKSDLWRITWPLNLFASLVACLLFIKKKLKDAHIILLLWLITYSLFLSFIIGWPHYMLLFLPYSYILLVAVGYQLIPYLSKVFQSQSGILKRVTERTRRR